MNCQKCNAENKDSNRYCYLCGHELIVTKNTADQSDTRKLMKDLKTWQSRSTDATSSSKSTSVIHKTVRIIFAVLACLGIWIIYTLIGVALGWRHGGGAIPMLIMFALIGFTWRAITGKKK